MSIYGYDAVLWASNFGGNTPWLNGAHNVYVEFFGPGYDGFSGTIEMWTLSSILGCETRVEYRQKVTGPGAYTFSQSEGLPCDHGLQVRADPYHLAVDALSIQMIELAGIPAEPHQCFPDLAEATTANRCYSVPEPAAVAMLGPGLLMLGFVGWRRRRSADGRV